MRSVCIRLVVTASAALLLMACPPGPVGAPEEGDAGARGGPVDDAGAGDDDAGGSDEDAGSGEDAGGGGVVDAGESDAGSSDAGRWGRGT